jgi:signal transduction histidine kinase
MLRHVSAQLVEAQESERRQIARELHDEIGQILTGLKLTLEATARLEPDAFRARLSDAQAQIHELMVRVNDLSLNLRPAMLDDLGLVPTLLWHFDRYTAQTKVRVTFEHTGVDERRFAPTVETAAFRIVQESLTNVARHSGATEATVRLWRTDNMMGVQVEDVGAGFDPRAAAVAYSSGLSGMRERAAFLDGDLTIDSSPGAGTRVTCELPVAPR